MTEAQANNRDTPRLRVFRWGESADCEGIDNMHSEPLAPVAAEGASRLMAAGIEHGHENRVLFSGGGLSLVYVWFKSGYPLPRHSHNTDCLYYIIAGSLSLGTERLDAGDGFFVGAGIPYTYVPGPEGVEVLEFRGSEYFNIEVLAENPGFWKSALKTVQQSREKWPVEARPSTD